MNADRRAAIADRYARLRIAVVGDFFLDRYLIIDPAQEETSIETGLPVHQVVEVRSQPGAAGTVVNNLAALGVGEIVVVGFHGLDGEGYELRRALEALPGVNLEHFLATTSRRTPVYVKPLVIEPGRPPRELNRFDAKNGTETPRAVQDDLGSRVVAAVRTADAMVLMDQVDRPETGVVSRAVREAAHAALRERDALTTLADSRQGLRDFPPFGFKMNAAELARMSDAVAPADLDPDAVAARALDLARQTGRPVFVTLAERGIVGAMPGRAPAHVAAWPVRGPIDVVGAGDAVTANLVAALAAGAEIHEAMRLAMAAASLVVHQLGATGTASGAQIDQLMSAEPIP